MPSMTREEALTKLAMEWSIWPVGKDASVLSDNGWVGYSGWLAERKRLINKPSWATAPDWAESLGQCEDGSWEWYEDESPECGEEYWNHDLNGVPAQKGLCPAGHDWRSTLERRPDSQKPALSTECMNSAMDAVNHPDHYQSDTGIECIDAIRASLGKEGFIAYCRGNAQKYAWRTGKKKEHAEDLRKAAWYLERAAKEMEA